MSSMHDLDYICTAAGPRRAVVYISGRGTIRVIDDPHPWHRQKTEKHIDGRKSRHVCYWPTETGWTASLTPEAS